MITNIHMLTSSVQCSHLNCTRNMFRRCSIFIFRTSFFTGNQITWRSFFITFRKHFHRQHFQWTTINACFGCQKPLHSLIRFARIRWTTMEYNFSIVCSCSWIPICWIRQIRNILQIGHAIQVGIYCLRMFQEIRK